MNLKKCSKCQQEKPVDCFGKHSQNKTDGLKAACKECRKLEYKKYYQENREYVIKRTSEYAKKNPEVKRKAVKKHRENNKGKYTEYAKAYRSRPDVKDRANRKRREWYAKNPEKVAEYNRKYGAKRSKAWRQRNPDKVNYQAMQRYCAKLQATPPWVDKEHKRQIAELYKQRRTMSEFHEIPFEVDHIEPLKGKNSCGLNVIWNLRIIPASENRRKYNKLLT